jgi:hypothetical protein
MTRRDGYFVTINARALATIARPDTTVGLSERKPTGPYVLQIATGEILPLSKEASVILTL